jgi:Flp pilus assembly protein TadD
LPEAEVFLARAQEVHPTLESEYGLAVTAAMRGESRTAVERLRNVLRIDPGYPPAVYDYIRILGEQGKTAEAERVLKSAIRGNPGEAGFVRILARLYSATGRKDLADRLMKTITDGGTGPVF